MIIAAAGGGLGLIVLLIVIIIVVRKRKQRVRFPDDAGTGKSNSRSNNGADGKPGDYDSVEMISVNPQFSRVNGGELRRNQIKLGAVLGAGAFGEVYKGTVMVNVRLFMGCVCLCICVCMYVFVCVCVFLCMCVCVCVVMRVRVYACFSCLLLCSLTSFWLCRASKRLWP